MGEHLHEVMFGQKWGWYTRIPGQYETHEGRPVAYVGKASHGFYHDDGGSGTCCYFEDFRNPRKLSIYFILNSIKSLSPLCTNGSCKNITNLRTFD